MAQVEDQIVAENIQIVWVLQQDRLFRDGTAERCRTYIDSLPSSQGLCVGDAETLPMRDVFDDSGIAIGRGFDVLVRRSDMRIVYSTTHGTVGGNENITGEELLTELRRIISGG